MSTLGQTLKLLRKNSSMTLKEIEEKTGVSNAYLSQLENDKIKNPSVFILTKLSQTFDVPINEILIQAGLISSKRSSKTEQLSNKIAFSTEKLSPKEMKEVLDYIAFLKSKK